MRSLTTFSLLVLLALLSACASTPDSRIAQHQAEFSQFPPQAQQQIRAGEVAVGFTPEMVRLALGEPTRVFMRQSESGDVEVWSYHESGPRFGFGFGIGTFGRHSASAVSVGSSVGGGDPEEKTRVEFRDGRVSAVETVRH